MDKYYNTKIHKYQNTELKNAQIQNTKWNLWISKIFQLFKSMQNVCVIPLSWKRNFVPIAAESLDFPDEKAELVV